MAYLIQYWQKVDSYHLSGAQLVQMYENPITHTVLSTEFMEMSPENSIIGIYVKISLQRHLTNIVCSEWCKIGNDLNVQE